MELPASGEGERWFLGTSESLPPSIPPAQMECDTAERGVPGSVEACRAAWRRAVVVVTRLHGGNDLVDLPSGGRDSASRFVPPRCAMESGGAPVARSALDW